MHVLFMSVKTAFKSINLQKLQCTKYHRVCHKYMYILQLDRQFEYLCVDNRCQFVNVHLCVYQLDIIYLYWFVILTVANYLLLTKQIMENKIKIEHVCSLCTAKIVVL